MTPTEGRAASADRGRSSGTAVRPATPAGHADGADPDRVCVIGAGSSGIAACRALQAAGVPFDCFELGSRVGGNWRYRNDNGISAAYRSLHINTSRRTMEFREYPMPESLPDFPSHFQIAAYFDDYVAHFGLAEHIRFRTEVVRVEPVGDGTWDVTTRPVGHEDETTTRYRAVVVANGHHWDPRWPEPGFPGEDDFTGERMHAHTYDTPEALEGKRVLVLGIGNSATDIAVEASRIAERTILAMRRSAHVIPKYVFGKPMDELQAGLASRVHVPLALQRATAGALLRVTMGRMTDYGLQAPDHRLFEAHPTISSELLGRVGHGDIAIRPTIDRFTGGRGVRFTDGTEDEVDLVVYCTGYRIRFPFLDEDVVRTADNHVPLYRRVVAPDRQGLYFVGLVQPIGAVMPLAEAQSGWIAALLTGENALPEPAAMHRAIRDEEEAMARQYLSSKRHTIQVDFYDYLRLLARERRLGPAAAEPGTPLRRVGRLARTVRARAGVGA